MKLKFYAVSAVATFVFALSTNTKVYTNSTVPPPGRTGDPINNVTCASGSGCHGTTNLDGTSVIDIKIGVSAGAQSTITPAFVPVPGTDYFMTVLLNGTAQKYGFAISALTASNQQAGSFTITNTTQTIKNTANGIEYVTHKNSSSTKSWIYKWTAPSTVSEPIVFYATANLADGNGNEGGDAIYKKVASINGIPSAVADLATLSNVTLYPNPATENITVNYNVLSNEFVTGQIMTTEGKVVKTLFSANQQVGIVNASYNISELVNGNYFLHVTAGGKSTIKPFVKY